MEKTTTVFPIDSVSAALPLPKVIIPLKVLTDMFSYAAVANNEVGGVGYVEERKNELYISEIFLLRQKANAAEMVLDPLALNEFVGECEKPELVRMQWHSHGAGSVFFSSQDVETISGYDMPYAISIVVNKNYDIRCRIDIFEPMYVCFEAVVFIEIEHQGINEAREEVIKNVKETGFLGKLIEGNPQKEFTAPKKIIFPIGEIAGMIKLMEGGMLS